jgi:Uncharacterized protein conserved in bacteria
MNKLRKALSPESGGCTKPFSPFNIDLGNRTTPQINSVIAREFIIPLFSVIRGCNGEWQECKKACKDQRICNMDWITPEYDRAEVNAAAKVLLKNHSLSDEEHQWASDIVNNWRYAHNYPLNTFKVTLRSYAKKASPNAIVAERRKRLESILFKLDREPKMQLSQMQDIAGCRAIVDSKAGVYRLLEIYKKSNLKHKLHRVRDYIHNPKASGYRGVHMIYKYNSDKIKTWNNLKVELQIRTQLQHVWATAVETVGAFTRQALKSSMGKLNGCGSSHLWVRISREPRKPLSYQTHRPTNQS